MAMRGANREFTVAGEYRYNREGARGWILSHLLRYKGFVASFLLASVLANIVVAAIPALTGAAFTAVRHGDRARLLVLALAILAMVAANGVTGLIASFADEFLGKRVERDARDELYVSLLGKSQTFHNRQRVGDIMARAANDVGQINSMIVPGLDLIVNSALGLVTPIIFIAFISPQLLLAPLLFTAVFAVALRRYIRRLQPVAGSLRGQFGTMNAGLSETITGIEVVKGTAQEDQEERKFERNARRYRDLLVENGQIQARYLPPLLLAIATAGGFVHGLYLVTHHQLSAGNLVAYMGLLGLLHFPTFISIFTFSLFSFGVAAAERIVAVLNEETELDENEGGYRGAMRGELAFEGVTFGYGDTDGTGTGDRPILRDVSFRAAPGQVVAIVGQTGSGKSTLTKLVNRIYDTQAGRVTVDGVDVRDWSLDALRAGVSSIEQDIVLFSRSIEENIAFSRGQQASHAEVEQAAREAQAHEFIMGFGEGYDTMVGERGVTLSGGQRQRVAIARALLTDPRILILDDSTSAIDSATEDLIQQAMRRLMRDRTTLLITHRLSQIRQADLVLVLDRGAIVDQGAHDELLARCALYRRIFHGESKVESRKSEVPVGALADV
jgi:ATP-binding cassette subfamily B protein